jgi:subtilisin family serine protease
MRKFGIAASALVLMLTSAGPLQAGASVKAAAGKGDAAAAGLRIVTLITGDRVVLEQLDGPDRIVTIHPGKDRTGMTFRQDKEHDDTYVIPSDAARLVAARQVDRRLFNVSKLVEFGYDDGRHKTLPVITTKSGGGKALRALGGAEARQVSKQDTGAFWSAATQQGGRIWLDGPVRAALDRSAAQVGAPAAWQAGFKGAGAVVAVLDTGIDAKHPDLADAVIGAQDFTGSPGGGTGDGFGHGTHVAGIITGGGQAAGGRYVGIAPQAKLLNGKVLDDNGGGRESWIIAGMEWAAAQGADVINLSLGSPWPSDGTEPMDLAVNRLTAETGALFVVAAGNSGPGKSSIGSPAAADAALTVGAVDRNDGLAEFSSRGPRWSNQDIKPDLTAPGVDIASALGEGALLGEFNPIVDERYLILSGTSMAAPHTAGAAAILAAQHPQWRAAELKSALMGAALPNPGLSVFEQGAGRLDVAKAVTRHVRSSPASLSNGVARWPHHDDAPIARDVTYHNDGAHPVTLALGFAVPNAPAGMFTVDQPRLVVPANGTAVARVVTDTSVPAADGVYGGYLNAVDAGTGEVAVRTPIGVTREVESYDVALTFLDRTGRNTPEYFARFVNTAVREAVVPYDESGRVVARVPKGKHYFEADISSPDQASPRGWDLTVVVEPELDVSADLVLTIDARRAKPAGPRLDQPEARSGEAGVVFDRRMPWGLTGAAYIMGGYDFFFVMPSATSATVGGFTFALAGAMARPDGQGGFSGSPYLYHHYWSREGRVPEDLQPRLRDSDFVKVQTRIAAAGPHEVAWKDWMVALPTPAELTEYYSPGMTAYPSLVFNFDPAEFTFDGVTGSAEITYRAGRPLAEHWNKGVFGPAFPAGGPDAPYVARLGDRIEAFVPLFTDQGAAHAGDTRIGTTLMTLSRNGEPIGESPELWGSFELPPQTGAYRLAITSTRPSTLSTRVSAAWTFTSGTVAGEEPKPLPLMAVRVAPHLDEHNRARAGLPMVIPVSVQRQDGSDAGRLRSLSVDVSFDDGQTWRGVPVLGFGPDRFVILKHPNGSGFVSWRAKATDDKGNTVEQTSIRGYAYTP